MREKSLPGENAESVRQAIKAIIADRELLLRKARRAKQRDSDGLERSLTEIVHVAAHLDDMVRTLYGALPESLRPEETPRSIDPKSSNGSGGKQPNGKERAARIPREQRYPPLTEQMVLEMADAHFAKHGVWPTAHSGNVGEDGAGTWSALDEALRLGCRGLPGGSSVVRLIAAHREVHKVSKRKVIPDEQISEWAEAHHRRTGEWPRAGSGEIPEAPGETWNTVDKLMRRGSAGLSERNSLAKYLERTRGVPIHGVRPPLTEEQILGWADAHYERTGAWPTRHTGDVADAPGEAWSRVDSALLQGQRSLPNGGSLAILLAEHRGRRHHHLLPPIDIETVNGWVLKHYLSAGRLPRVKDGEIDGAPGETWAALDQSFRCGNRGLADSGCRSLKDFLKRRFPRPEFGQYSYIRPVLTYTEILAWVDAHHARTGAWPIRKSGAIPEAPEETWARVCHCMERGYRGLPKAMSLATFLEERRGVTHPHHRKLTIDRVLAWADAHFARKRSWPRATDNSPIPESPNDTWKLINSALIVGSRGVPKSGSLAMLLYHRRGRRHLRNPPPLNLDDLELWARNYTARHGHWPSHYYGGIVEEAPEEAWRTIHEAFRHGRRGLLLSGYTSLTDFLKKRLGPEANAPLKSWHSYEVRPPRAAPKRKYSRRR